MDLIAKPISAGLGSPVWLASSLFTLLTNVISLFAAVVVVIAGVIGLIWWWTSDNPYRRRR